MNHVETLDLSHDFFILVKELLYSIAPSVGQSAVDLWEATWAQRCHSRHLNSPPREQSDGSLSLCSALSDYSLLLIRFLRQPLLHSDYSCCRIPHVMFTHIGLYLYKVDNDKTPTVVELILSMLNRDIIWTMKVTNVLIIILCPVLV